MAGHWLAPRFVLVAGLLLAAPATAIEWTSFEGAARGYPAMRDLAGRTIADGEFAQWIENGRLHVSIAYVGKTRRIQEKAVFRQEKQLAQETWSLRELRDGALYRQFEVNFIKGTASAQKRGEDGKQLERWSDDVTVDVGRAFAGFGFTLAVKAVRARLKRGERVELQAVGFTPKPQVVTVDRTRVDLLPGGSSEAATPVATTGRRQFNDVSQNELTKRHGGAEGGRKVVSRR
jgi:hypothetical protein